MRNCIFIKNQNNIWTDLSSKLKDKYQIKPLMWVGGSEDFTKGDVIYYSHKSALLLKNPIEDLEKLNTGLTIDEINYLTKKNQMFFNLMNRWSVFSEKISYDDKLEYFLKSYEVWKNFNLKKNIDLVISPTIPHRLYDYTLYLFCNYNNIKFIMGNETTDIFFDKKINDYKTLSFYQDKIQNIKIKNYKFNNKLDNQDFEKYEKKIQSRPSSYTKKNLQKNRKNAVFLKIKYSNIFILLKIFFYRFFFFKNKIILLKFDSLLRKQSFPRLASKAETLFDFYKRRKKFLEGLNYYNLNCEKLNNIISKKYIVFFGGKIPERSNNPDAGNYFDEVQTISLIVNKMPEDYFLIYKEHPSNKENSEFISDKDHYFYKRLKKISKRILFVSPTIDRAELIKNSKAVCNLTGSATWEAYILNKPSFNFGGNWFNNFNQIFTINNSKDLELFFKVKINEKIERKKTEEFFYDTLKRCSINNLREINQNDLVYDFAIEQHSSLINDVLENK